jgi:hypothetical protein
MKLLKRSLLSAAIAAALQASPHVAAAEDKVAIQVLMDDSGTLSSPAQAQEYKLLLFGFLQELRKRRDTQDARIDVISTSLGRSVWVGSPSDLRTARAESLVSAIEAKPDHCNNLPGAFAELDLNLRALESQGYSDIRVVVFSSLIHTPAPCAATTKITLPQPPPPLDLTGILTGTDAVSAIAFQWVNPYQRRPWLDALDPVADWAKREGKSFKFQDIENTMHDLGAAKRGLWK